MISNIWENPDAPPDTDADTPDLAAGPPDDDTRQGPAWQDDPDDTDLDRPRRVPAARTDTLPALLIPLCDAADALARLDARAAAALPAIRDGLLARMALAEAAGWLAHAHAWVHPLDLALRDQGLTGTYAIAATGSAARALPHTAAAIPGSAGSPTSWEHPTFDEMADGDRAVADALALAQRLRRLASPGKDRFATAEDAATILAPFGAGPLDAARFAGWRTAFAPVAPSRRFARGGEGPPHLPPLLRAAEAAAAWMAAGIADLPTPLQALLAAAHLLAAGGPARSVFLPVWAACPAVGQGDRDALPGLRSAAADRVAGRGSPVSWPLAFLHLVAESARGGLRELDRLATAAARGSDLTARIDRRSRLPDTVAALLERPVLTPKALAARLAVAPQTATALLRDLAATGLVREVTGRGSFRAFAI